MNQSKLLMRRMSKRQFARFLKRNETPHEHILWKVLQQRRLSGIHFQRQVPILGWIADFLAPDLKLLIEIDGDNHRYGKQRRKDEFRDRVMATAGYSTLRFDNWEVLHELPRVTKLIKQTATTMKTKRQKFNDRP